MEEKRKIKAPEGFEIEKVEIVHGVAVVTFREKERKIPETWEEFCEMTPIKEKEWYIDIYSKIRNKDEDINRHPIGDVNVLPDKATAEAVLALCQLIQLRNCYNGGWMPDWLDSHLKYVIYFEEESVNIESWTASNEILYFKTAELRDKFMCNFRPLIEKLKPLYGIKEGGDK